MTKRFLGLLAWGDARAPRERAFLLAACLAVSCGLWNLVLVEPNREQRKEIHANVRELEEGIHALELRGEEILHAHAADPNGQLQKRAEELRRQIATLDERIHEHTVTLISPSEMARFLEEMLSEETDLRLLRLENFQPEPLLEIGEPASTTDDSGAGIFRHRFVIQFRGRYMSTLRYLRALEELPWNFFWETLEYEVSEYPDGKVTIRAFTISADEGWVGA